MSIKLTSKAFQEGALIPSRYTCDGDNVSPPLEWSNVPDGTVSFALISDDPDAPMGDWVHWVLFNLPASVRSLEEGIPAVKELPTGAKHGINDFRSVGYG
ncbi:MAG: YbhB/YbcL family Raf kinase inhibitor-like protein, partial [Candidatus Omnitrophica bacterium]|nr:YbhB/YbcL family Raf kinase inhibitor-like protein [Candidatus Omnitrophota bacterium]